MAIRERAPRPQLSERKQPPDATAIASHVAGMVNNLQRDRQAIQNPFDLCRRADMTMVAALQVVTLLLPDTVQAQVQRLITIHDALYQTALPSTQQQEQAGNIPTISRRDETL